MTTLGSGKDRLQHIVNILKEDTLEPARKEADKLIVEAHAKADRIIEKATEDARKIIADGKARLERERAVFDSSLEQACKQSAESLRQFLMNELFDAEIIGLAGKGGKDVKIVADLVEAIVNSIDKDGLGADLSVVIGKAVSKEEVNATIAANILSRIKGGSVVCGDFNGGVKVQMHDEKLTIDISDQALKDLLSNYLRKDFRKILFKV